jgi:hypothetical protein
MPVSVGFRSEGRLDGCGVCDLRDRRKPDAGVELVKLSPSPEVCSVRVRLLATGAAIALVGTAVPASALAHHAAKTDPSGPLAIARDSAPIVLTGAAIPAWAAPAAEGLAKTQPSGANTSDDPLGDNLRSAHNGQLVVPPTPPGVTQVDPDTITAYSWVDGSWKEIRVQVDQRFPYFLANGRSAFGFYSGTDEELTYAWGSDAHSVGEEAWKKMFGDCASRLGTPEEIAAAIKAGWLTPGQGETAASYLSSTQDPQPLFDTDDELSFMARDAAGQAPSGQAAPAGATNGQAVTITDPLDPSTVRYVYLFTKPGGSSFTADNGYVQMTRDADSEQWIDRDSFDDTDPMKIGVSNTSYGPNLPGTVCDTSPTHYAKYGLATNADGTAPTTPRPSSDRQPRDDFTVSTPTYQLHATGRWLVQGLRVVEPNGHADGHGTNGNGKALGHAKNEDASGDDAPDYGPNIIARWKGRAFQQTPNSSISVVGFEDEQVNWELNSALLGWRQGPVRAIREIWGADSGTNVTKTEYYYRDADVFNYHTRVHPIPPDGLYTDWDYRPDVATTYYNLKATGGVPIDGIPDANVGEVDQVPVTGKDAETNVCDPTTQVCSAIDNPEEVAGPGFGLVYEFEITSATNFAGNVAVVPYYRDDACFDDGTGDAPVQRPFPGDAITDNGSRVENAYIANAIAKGAPTDLTWDQLVAECHKYAAAAPWGRFPFQAAIGEHGLHFFVTQDSDNTFSPKNTDEVDGQQWRFEVPMAQPKNVLVNYGANVSSKLVPVVTPFGG